MKKQKGITLIALVITIIVLIILAGLAINLTLGDNGIFNKAKYAKEKYNEESIREKVELGIMEIEIEELTLGNGVTIESVLQELLEKGIFETIDKDTAIGNIGEYEVKLKYNENQKIEIEYIQKARGVRVTYKLNPESYTNSEKVSILLTVNGTVKSVTKPDNLVIYPENETLAIDYQVTSNGTYKFIIESEDGSKQEKNVVVDTIDRLAPNDFTITAKGVGLKIKITANATDVESDGVSEKSGIGSYEYFVKKENDLEYTKYETNEIEVEDYGTYSVYVIAYDKAKNSKTSNTIEIILEELLYSRRYVDYGIDLNDDGDTTNDWMIFYEEDGTVNPNYKGATYIIPKYYVPYTKMQTSIANAGMRLQKGTYAVDWSSIPSTFIKNNNYETIKEIFMYDYPGETNISARVTSTLLNTDYWKEDFVTSELQLKGGFAIGGPTAKLWCASWNKTYPTETISTGFNDDGYYSISMNEMTGYKIEAPNAYFPIKTDTDDRIFGYWMASPMHLMKEYLLYANYQGMVTGATLYTSRYEYIGLRPIVYLPPSVKLEESGIPNLYNINYGE